MTNKYYHVLILILCSIFLLQINIFALSPIETFDENVLIGLSYTEPNQSISRDSDPPYFNPWYVTTDGRYYFEGSTSSYSLYTEYYFTGQSAYRVQITNHGSQDVSVTFKSFFTTFRTVTISPGQTYKVRFSTFTSDSEITENTDWYLKFSSPCDVSGFVDVWTDSTYE